MKAKVNMDNQKEESPLVYIVQKREACFIKGSEFDGSFGPWEIYAEAGIFPEIGPAVRRAESCQQTYDEIIDKAGTDPHGYWWKKTQFRVISVPSSKVEIAIKGKINVVQVFGQ
jgi:hypothetical protein